MTRLRIANGSARPGSYGTVAALVALSDDPASAYLLSASHVMAPYGAQPGDTIRAQEDCPPSIRAGDPIARLVNWTGLVPGFGYPNAADAAIARLESRIDPRRDLPGLVGLRFAKARPAVGERLRLPWDSGGGAVRDPARDCVIAWFDPAAPDPDHAPEVDYGVADLIVCDAMEAPGDSGAAVIADSTGDMVGLVSGKPFPELGEQGTLSAVSPIDAIAAHPQWGGRLLQPWIAGSPPVPAPAGHALDVLTILSKTLWAEARNQGDDGMAAVAWVVLNRVKARRLRWGLTPKDACLAPMQFSCWNAGTPSRAQLHAMSPADPKLDAASSIAQRALAVPPVLPDPTHGATSYYAPAAVATPYWAVGHKPCAVIGGHVFFNDVR